MGFYRFRVWYNDYLMVSSIHDCDDLGFIYGLKMARDLKDITYEMNLDLEEHLKLIKEEIKNVRD